MNATRPFHHRPADWLLDSQLAPYVDAFKHHLTEGRYSSHTAGTYIACIAHFAHWATQRLLDIQQINEGLVGEFLDGHLPCCDCAWPVHRARNDLRAALGHLLFVLRANAVIPEPALGTTPVETLNCAVSMTTWTMSEDSHRRLVTSTCA